MTIRGSSNARLIVVVAGGPTKLVTGWEICHSIAWAAGRVVTITSDPDDVDPGEGLQVDRRQAEATGITSVDD